MTEDDAMPADERPTIRATIHEDNALKVNIASIRIEGRRRIAHDVTDLARSMNAVGLLNPITVTDDLRLVAGWHRLEAAKMLGWTEIEARTVSDVDAELAMIDENLMRHELHYVERGDWLARRKVLYEERHPETRREATLKRGPVLQSLQNGVRPPSFVEDTAAKVEQSQRAIYNDLAVATKTTPELKTALIAQRVPQTDALKLAKLPAQAQQVAAVSLSNGAKPEQAIKDARAAIPKPPRQEVLTPVPADLRTGDARSLPLPDESVDLIVTSPPYGLDIPYSGSTDPSENWYAFMGEWMAEAFRVARVNGRLAINVPLDTTDGGYRPTYPQAVQAAIGAGWSYRFAIVWNEGNVSKSVARGSVDSPSAPHVIAPVEMIAVFSKGPWLYKSDKTPDLEHEEWLQWTNGFWTFHGESRAWEGHPAPFPEELPRRLIKLLSYPGDVVLDPFVGSGTTTLVAYRLGREAVGFDISAEYVAAARRRVAQAVGERSANTSAA